jgi:predicted lipoprotein with Yx(FWY)xxD motif
MGERQNHRTEEVSMKKFLILAAILAPVALAACGGGGGGSESATAATPGGSSATVAVQDLGNAGRVLVDSSGKALYASDQEANGMVLCTGACESIWMPLTVKSGQPTGSVPGKLGVIRRPDGSEQVTYRGRPLYSFTQEGPGEVTGDGFQDAFGGQQFTWHVVSVGGGGGSPATSSNGGRGFAY